MAIFKSSEEAIEILGGYFKEVSKQVADEVPEFVTMQNAIGESNLITRFEYSEPECVFVLDFSQNPLTVTINDSSITPTVSFKLKADVAHKFWHGKVNLAMALTKKDIVAKGPIPKILKLLPQVKPMYELYPKYLTNIGRADLIVK